MKIKINNEFKKDVLFWIQPFIFAVFVILVWYSITHFLIETLHLPIPNLRPSDSIEVITNVFGTIYIIGFCLVIGISAVIFKIVKGIINYIFIIER